MTWSYSVAVKNARLDAIATELDALATALLRVYSGTEPANADTALSGNTLLSEHPMTDPVAPAAASGVLTFSAIGTDSSANATGTASFVRFVDSGGTVIAQGTIGVEATIDNTSITAGQEVQVTSGTITSGN